MEIISGNTENTKINYFGKGVEFALIFFKNVLLTIFTLGLYYPWAKVAILEYQYQHTKLNDKAFQFHAKPKEIFIGFVKIYAIIAIFYLLFILAIQANQPVILLGALGVFYLLLILIIPFAIHGAIRYRASKSSWKGIFFKYLGNKTEFFWLYLKGMLLTFLTLGIYGFWFQTEVRKYIISHLRFGDVSFDFHGEGKKLFKISLKFLVLFYLTLGIYSFWYYKELWQFYVNNTSVTQNGKSLALKFKMEVVDVFQLIFINGVLFVFTLGLATPWIIARTLKFFFRYTEVDGYLNINAIQQVKYDNFEDATGDSFIDFLDIDLV